MSGQADGSIIIDTELDSEGFEAGSSELLAAIKSLAAEVQKLGTTLTEIFKSPITPNVNTDDAEAHIASLEAQVQELQKALEEMRASAGASTSSTVPGIDMGGTGQKASSLQKEINSVVSGVERLEPTLQKAMSGSASAMSSFRGQAAALEKRIAAIRERMEAVGQTQFPTQEYQELSAEAEKAGQKLESLRNKQEKLQALGAKGGQVKVPTDDYRWFTQEIQKAENALNRLELRQTKMKAIGVEQDSKQWQSLQYDIQLAEQALANYEAGLKTLKSSGGDFTVIAKEDSAQWKSLQYDLDLATKKYEQLAAAKARMESSGTAYQMGTDTTQYAQMESALTSAASRLEAMRESASKTNRHASSLSGTMRKNASLMSRIAKAARTMAVHVGTAAKSAAGKLTQGIKSAASGMAKLLANSRKTKGQFSGLISGAKRFAISLLGARGVYALLQKAVSAYMDANQQLSNTLSACWSGIGSLLGPIITRLINLVAQAVAYVTSFLKLFGIVGKATTDAIDSAGGAASKETDKLKRQLASFDELNILSDNSSDSGGGGGSSTDADVTLPDVTLPDWAKLMAEQIKAGDWAGAATTLAEQLNSLVDSVDWAGIGDKLAYGIDSALTFLATFIQKFDWKNLGSHLGTMMNHILDGVDWGNLGTVLTAKWAIILQMLDGFFSTLSGASVSKALTDFMYGTVNAADWVGISASLSKNISRFISEIDFAALAQALSAQIRKALQSMIAAVDNFEWAMLGQKIADFINGIDWAGIFSDLATLLSHLLNNVISALTKTLSKTEWTDIGKALAKGLNSAVQGIGWSDLGSALGAGLSSALDFLSSAVSAFEWASLGELLADAFMGIWSSINWAKAGSTLSTGFVKIMTGLRAYITNIDWQQMGRDVATAIANIDWGGVFEALTSGIGAAMGALGTFLLGLIESAWNDAIDWWHDAAYEDGEFTIDGLLDGMAAKLEDIHNWLVEHILNPFLDGFGEIFGIDSYSTVMAEQGEYIIRGLWQGLLEGIGNITEWLRVRIFEPFISGFKSLFGINSPSTVMAEQGEYIVEGLLQGIEGAWGSVIDYITTAVDGIFDAINAAWENIMTTTSSTWNSISSSLTSTWNSIKSSASSTFSNIKSIIQNQGWSGVGSSIVSGIKSGISNGWSTLTSWIKQKAQSLLSAAKSALGINSPSRLFRDEVGLNIGLGIGEGVEKSESSVLKSVTGVADAIAGEMNSGSYTLGGIVPTTEVNGAITDFTDRITDGFSSMLDRLQAIAESVTFSVPTVATSAVPYKVAYASDSSSNANIGDTIETSNEELSAAVIQTVTNAAAAIVNAIHDYSGTTINLDANSLTDTVVAEINRKTRMNGKTPLLI